MYQLIDASHVLRLADVAKIPFAEGNSDYEDFLQWEADGNVVLPANEPVFGVPQVVTMRQARLALLGAGMLGAVTTAINNLPEPDRSVATIEWEYSQEVNRNRALIQALGPLLGLSNEQLDGLFIMAATL